ncbi:hypothetical protein OROGR_023174 [Orobanche gracilis]
MYTLNSRFLQQWLMGSFVYPLKKKRGNAYVVHARLKALLRDFSRFFGGVLEFLMVN